MSFGFSMRSSRTSGALERPPTSLVWGRLWGALVQTLGVLLSSASEREYGATAPVFADRNERQGDGPARIVDGAVLVSTTTPTHMTANATTLPAITAGPRE